MQWDASPLKLQWLYSQATLIMLFPLLRLHGSGIILSHIVKLLHESHIIFIIWHILEQTWESRKEPCAHCLISIITQTRLIFHLDKSPPQTHSGLTLAPSHSPWHGGHKGEWLPRRLKDGEPWIWGAAKSNEREWDGVSLRPAVVHFFKLHLLNNKTQCGEEEGSQHCR